MPASVTQLSAASSAASIRSLVAELNAAFPERRNVTAGAVAALLAREHVLLLGPPGTAKSAITRALVGVFQARYFETLLSKFSTPEEVFGPLSLKALETDRFARKTDGYLPTAEIAFVDEIFKSNSATLNSLLAIVNERVFHNDGSAQPCPLVSLFGASNELPESKELEALFDRFLLRFEVQYLASDDSFRAIVGGDPADKVTTRLTLADLQAAQAEVDAVKVTDATVDALLAVRAALKAEGIQASDRRYKKALRVAQAFAWLAGDTETSPQDLAFLADSLWREPKERAKVARIVGQVCDPVGAKATEVLDAAREEASKLAGLAAGQDRKAYIAAAAGTLERFRAQVKELDRVAKGAGRRAASVIADARAEIVAMEKDAARAVSAGLGLR